MGVRNVPAKERSLWCGTELSLTAATLDKMYLLFDLISDGQAELGGGACLQPCSYLRWSQQVVFSFNVNWTYVLYRAKKGTFKKIFFSIFGSFNDSFAIGNFFLFKVSFSCSLFSGTPRRLYSETMILCGVFRW